MIAEVDLDRQAGQPRDFDLRERTEAAHEREDQPLVVEAHARLVGAAGDWRRDGGASALSSSSAGIATPCRAFPRPARDRRRAGLAAWHATSRCATPDDEAAAAPVNNNSDQINLSLTPRCEVCPYADATARRSAWPRSRFDAFAMRAAKARATPPHCASVREETYVQKIRNFHRPPPSPRSPSA